MIVMWDVDGVLANFHASYTELANQMCDTSLSPNGVPKTWYSVRNVIGKDNDDRVWNHIKQSKTFWYDLAPLISYAEQDRIRHLSRSHTMYYVTSRVGATAKDQTERWLATYLGVALMTPTTIISSRKADAANALKANYTIDDKLGNVLAVYYNSPSERRVYVFDAPYNQLDQNTAGANVRRVSTVSQFLDDIEAGR